MQRNTFIVIFIKVQHPMINVCGVHFRKLGRFRMTTYSLAHHQLIAIQIQWTMLKKSGIYVKKIKIAFSKYTKDSIINQLYACFLN